MELGIDKRAHVRVFVCVHADVCQGVCIWKLVHSTLFNLASAHEWWVYLLNNHQDTIACAVRSLTQLLFAANRVRIQHSDHHFF
jgi:hypothetical protein